MRVFVAIELPFDVRESIAALQNELKVQIRSARWVRPENLHLTLRFIGETDTERVRALARSIPERIVGLDPFELELHGLGCFPNPKRARVLWVGVQRPPAGLVRLHAAVEASVRQVGFEPDPRPFDPHLTLARLRRPDPNVARLAPELSDRSFGRFTVSDVVILESRLSQRGSSYHVLERISLGGTLREQLV